jgi:pimeloyl-ACP methyl ester carboxylesterase
MRMRSVDVNGLQVAYTRTGRGPALMLLHGYVGDGVTTWRPQLEALSDEFTVVAWDAPGAGASSDPPEDFGIAGYADCLAAFIREVGLDRPHLMGLSFGGALALAHASGHPAQPASLILASAYAGWRGSLPADAAEQRLRQALALADATPSEFTDTLLPTMFTEGTPAEILEDFGAALRCFHPAGFRAMSRASAEDLTASLADVRVPTLLVYGNRDIRAPLTVATHLRDAIPQSSLRVLEGVGHLCNLEAAGRFNAAVREFLHAAQP